MANRRTLALTLTLCLFLLAQPWTAAAAGAAKNVAKNAAKTTAQVASDGFDPAKVQSLEATVSALKEVAPSSHNGYIGPGLNMMVSCGQESLYVPLGPKYVLERQPVRLAVGDKILLTGMRPNPEEPVLLVSEIRKGEAVATFRDAQGNLSWKTPRAEEAKAKAPKPGRSASPPRR